MAMKTDLYEAILASPEIAAAREQHNALYITVNLLNVIPAREVQPQPKGTEVVSNHYWMNSLPFVKQNS